MYKASARYYDALYSMKDYAGEADKIDRIIQREAPGARTLLDVACGTGHHIEHLSKKYSCEGVDLTPEMLEVARERLPAITFRQGSMLDFDLSREFDAVVCLFSSIGYMQSIDQLNGAVRNMARHLSEGGVLIVESWFTPEQWVPGHLHGGLVDRPDLKIARMNISDRDGDFAVMRMHHLAGTDEGIDYFVEEHRMRLFTHEQYTAAFTQASLRTTHDEEGLINRALYIGVRKT